MRIVFVKTRHEYDSYRDFWKLVELSGFDTCFTEQMDLSADVIYITTPINGDFRPHIKHARSILSGPQQARVVWWNLERPDSDGSPHISTIVDELLEYCDAIWVSDRYYASLDSRMQYVVLGSHEKLCISTEKIPTEYDYTHQSYAWGRRDAIYVPLRRHGLKEGPNSWFEERDKVLRSSKLMLNVHQTPMPIGEPLRFAVTAAYRMPMVSEKMNDPYPLVAGHDYVDVHFDRLVDVIRLETNGHLNLPWIGNNLYNRLCVEWPFRRGVEAGASVVESQTGASK